MFICFIGIGVGMTIGCVAAVGITSGSTNAAGGAGGAVAVGVSRKSRLRVWEGSVRQAF